ncbi:MAG: quinone-dependent dihydroorotate dehydrogenase [Phototrophicaceae bacterium]
MINLLRKPVLWVNNWGYRAIRGILFKRPAQVWHERILDILAHADDSSFASGVASLVHRVSFRNKPIEIGGTHLPHPFILAAGFVKGHGFHSEENALEAVAKGVNIIPGWKSMPNLVGSVEFGSFTRQPRIGNDGTVMWRNAKTQSTQNRIGLKNPGVEAAATFLLKHIINLPHVFGINIAVSPGVDDEQAVIDVAESFNAFLKRGVIPNWFTLNVSCPNTEDDPTGNQTEVLTRALCETALNTIADAGYKTPLWVKLGPDLAESQYKLLLDVFAELGVKAIVATNTIGKPTPIDNRIQAGVGGGELHTHALKTATLLQQEIHNKHYDMDIIGCGGVIDGDSYLNYKVQGMPVVQYWSALVFRGPLAAGIIESELG